MDGDFLVTNWFRVPADKEEAILRVLRDAAVVVTECGAITCEIFTVSDEPAKYGCRHMGEVFGAAAGEYVCMEIMRFRDRAHCEEVMVNLNGDPRIGPLYEQLTALIDIGDIARGELERRA